MQSKIIFFSILTIGLSINISCGDKLTEKLQDKHIIPYVPVYTQIDLGVGGESNLQMPWQPVYMSASRPDAKPLGYNGHGIIVVKINNDEYKCWDATCTNCEDLNSFFTKEDLQAMTVVCPVCHLEFLLISGQAPEAEKRIYPLKEYPISKSGNKLIISY